MPNGPEYVHAGLAISVARSPRRAVVRWTGVSDQRAPGEFIGPWTEELVRDLKGVAVVVDLRPLEYMNSSTVAPLIQMVKGFDDHASEVLVLFDEASEWQQTHLRCMRSIARTLHHVKVDAKRMDGSR